jgi:hypothetical protein
MLVVCLGIHKKVDDDVAISLKGLDGALGVGLEGSDI